MSQVSSGASGSISIEPATSATERWRPRAYVVVLALLVAALAARLAFVAATSDYEPRFDPAAFDRYAVSIAQGDGYPESTLGRGGGPTAYRPPLYPHFLAGIYELVGTRSSPTRRWAGARIAQAGVGTATVALIGLIAFQLWGWRVTVPALALAAPYPPLIIVGGSLLSESLLLPLMLGALAASLQARRSPHAYRWAVVAGLLAGLATLSRSNAGVILLPLALAVWRPKRLSPRSLGAPALLIVSAALALAPWTIRNAIVMDGFVPVSTQSGYSLAGTYNDFARQNRAYPAAWVAPSQFAREYIAIFRRRGLTERERDQRLRSAAIDYVLDHPLYVAEVGYWNTMRLFHLGQRSYARISARNIGFGPRAADLGIYGFYPVGALALIGALTAGARRAPAFVWLTPALLWTSVLVAGGTRFRAPLEPFLILLAALALTAAWSRLRDLRVRTGIASK